MKVVQQLGQVDNLDKLTEPGCGLRTGTLFGAAAHGAVGGTVISARHVGAAVYVLTR